MFLCVLGQDISQSRIKNLYAIALPTLFFRISEHYYIILILRQPQHSSHHVGSQPTSQKEIIFVIVQWQVNLAVVSCKISLNHLQTLCLLNRQ